MVAVLLEALKEGSEVVVLTVAGDWEEMVAGRVVVHLLLVRVIQQFLIRLRRSCSNY